ncbi:MAG: 16S rRNA (adenine(1518)-N(6)/adenine(1519)-N(6))-dimethyltransferase RsmA [Thermoanaerobaculia bacterium]
MSDRHQPRRKWGQNFLRNTAAVRRIADAVTPGPGELVLEIGPGEGALTARLRENGVRLRAIEIDPSLVERLGRRFPSLDVVEGDATEAPLPEEPFHAVGNLPYNAGTSILRRVIADPNCRSAVFMLQKEVADRLTAPPGADDYGFLTVAVRVYADSRQIMQLDPGSFFPRPKVRSAVVALTPVKRPLVTAPAELVAVASAAFRMRRKKLVNSLTGFLGLERRSIEAAIAASGIEPNARAEELGLEEFDRLAQHLMKKEG